MNILILPEFCTDHPHFNLRQPGFVRVWSCTKYARSRPSSPDLCTRFRTRVNPIFARIWELNSPDFCTESSSPYFCTHLGIQFAWFCTGLVLLDNKHTDPVQIMHGSILFARLSESSSPDFCTGLVLFGNKHIDPAQIMHRSIFFGKHVYPCDYEQTDLAKYS